MRWDVFRWDIFSSSNILRFVQILFKKELGILLDYLMCPGVSKDKKQVVSGFRDTSDNPESMKWGCFGLSHNEIEKLLIQHETE